MVTTKGVSKLSTAVISANWAGVTKTLTITVEPALLEFSLSSTSVQSGGATQAVVHLAGASATGGETVTIAASGPVSALPTFTVPAGWTAASFTVTATGASAVTTAKLDATLGDKTLSATLTVSPASVTSFSFNPATIVGGAKTMATIRLSGPAGPEGNTLKLSGAGPITLPATVTIPSGKDWITFELSTKPVTIQTGMAITASFGTSSASGNLVVNPLTLSGFTLTVSSVIGGQNTDGHVLLNGPAPAGGVVVKLVSTGPVTVPAAITVPASASSYYFAIKTKAVTTKTTATITASYGGVSAEAKLTVSP